MLYKGGRIVKTGKNVRPGEAHIATKRERQSTMSVKSIVY